MNNDKVMVGGGAGFCGLLTIAFIVLKLCGVIGWSWWFVLLPMIINSGVVLITIIVIIIIAFVRYSRSRRRKK